MTSARTQAIARENASIDASQSRAIAARQAEDARPRNALEKMALRLDLSPDVLRNTLQKTVFSGCRNNEEFVALVAVANEYNLNPMLKEIYAFPAKGGRITPMVGYDGWVKLMNSHPQFDGIEYNDLFDQQGNLYAIEAVLYRKDRSHPIKVIEYLDECRRGTEPWQKMPRRMLRNRTTCQAARLGFGFTGISAEGDEEIIDGGTLAAQSLPARQTLAEELGDEIPAFDQQTGEIIEDRPQGMTEVSEEEARRLDAQTSNDGTLSEENPTAAEGPADEDRGEPEHDDKPAWWGKVQWIRSASAAAKNKQQLKDVDDEFTRIRAGLPDDVIAELDGLIAARRRDLTKTNTEN